jgi:hypothetical protein
MIGDIAVITVYDIYRLLTVSLRSLMIVYHGSHPLAHVTSRNQRTMQRVKIYNDLLHLTGE